MVEHILFRFGEDDVINLTPALLGYWKRFNVSKVVNLMQNNNTRLPFLSLLEIDFASISILTSRYFMVM